MWLCCCTLPRASLTSAQDRCGSDGHHHPVSLLLLLAVAGDLPQCRWAGRSSSPQESCTSPGAGLPAACGAGSPAGSVATRTLPGTWAQCCLGDPHRPFPPDPWLTCRSSSSFTRDQVLMKLSLRRVSMGGLSRTVSRRVRPEPARVRPRVSSPHFTAVTSV